MKETLANPRLHSQKFGKIKRRDADIFTGAGTAIAGTPVKVKATGTPKRGRSKATTEDEVEDDDEEMATPVKKVKKTSKKELNVESDEDK